MVDGKIDAISAIKAKVGSMTELEKQQFAKETGVDISAINIMSYDVAEKYCKNHNIDLGQTNIWAKYDKAKSDWNTYHEMYTQADKIYQNYHNLENKAQQDYNTAYAQALADNGGEAITSAQDSQIRRETKYTTETITNATNAELTADLLLDKCSDAGNDQRTGLNFGTMAEGFMNYKA